MENFKNISIYWNDLMNNKSDQRTTNWFLMSSPVPTIGICLAYVLIVKIIGPIVMKNQKPFKIKNIHLVYNFMHLVFSAWIFYESSILGWMTDYSFRCQPVDYATTGKPMRLAEISWWYFMSKIIDLAETLFYVLEKRFHLITIYHVVHHSIMLFVWLGVKYVPGGHITFFAWINCFVHLFIYGYLVLRTVAPAFKTYLLIAKTYFPIVHLIEFSIIFLHEVQLFIWNECNYPLFFSGLIAIGTGTLICLITVNWQKTKNERVNSENSRMIKNQL